MTWEEAENAYLEEMRDRRRPLTLERFSLRLKDFRESSGFISLDAVQADHLTAYLHQVASRIKVDSAWGYLCRLLPFFRWATRRKILLWDPGAGFKAPVPLPRHRRV